jgi:site-specific DNA recombinase
MEQIRLERRVRMIPATKPAASSGGPRHGRQRVAAYCRVSTNSEEQLNSYEAQKTYYTQKIEENPDWEMAGIFADEGITGTSMKKRKEFNRMIAACKRGRIDMILTKSLSRFARNTVDCLEMVRMLKANGIGVIFEKENINTLTESSEFLITLFSGFAQAESESLSTIITWGQQQSMKNGKVTFQYSKLLGYRRGEDGQPEIVPEDAETVKRIFRRYLDGCSLGQIKAELEADGAPTASGVKGWSYQVIHNILTNEKYIGDALLQKTYVTDCISKQVKKNTGDRTMYYVENNHPAIISRELFQRVQEELTRRASKRKVMQKTGKTEQGKYSAKYALSELLVCGECGTPYKRCTWARNGKKRIVWRCISRLEFGRKYCHTSPTLDEEKLHRVILEAINDFAQIEQEVKADILEWTNLAWSGRETDGASLLTLRQRLNDITAQQAILLDQVLAAMDDSALNAQLKTLMDEKQAVQEQIKVLEQDEIHSASQASRMEELKEWLAKLQVNEQYDDEQVRMAIEKITVLDPETIRIQFKYPGLEVDKSLNR